MSNMSSTSPRRRPRVVIAQLVRQDDAKRYLVYADEGTEKHDRFLNRLFKLIPHGGSTRPRIKDAVHAAGDGRYRVYYNSVIVDVGDARKRLQF